MNSLNGIYACFSSYSFIDTVCKHNLSIDDLYLVLCSHHIIFYYLAICTTNNTIQIMLTKAHFDTGKCQRSNWHSISDIH